QRAIVPGRGHDPRGDVERGISGDAGRQCDGACAEARRVGDGVADVHVDDIDKGAPAAALSVERSHAYELRVVDQIVGRDIDLGAAGGDVGLAADVGDVAVEAGAELPVVVGSLDCGDAEQ